MDDFVAQVVSRLERNAADHEAMSERSISLSAIGAQAGMGVAYRSAAAIVKELWAEEQARIAEEERGEPGYQAEDMGTSWSRSPAPGWDGAGSDTVHGDMEVGRG